jgi:hypothetical protein
VKGRSKLAAVLALTLTMNMPIAAHAQERDGEGEGEGDATPTATAAADWLVRVPSPIDLHVRGLARGPSTYDAPRTSFTPFAPLPSGIRLSKGATTAIIVGAIVVGVLLIAGIVVLSKPGKLH